MKQQKITFINIDFSIINSICRKYFSYLLSAPVIYLNVPYILSFNSFVPNALFLYTLKTSENLTVFECFQGIKKGCIRNEWVNKKDAVQIFVQEFHKIVNHLYTTFISLNLSIDESIQDSLLIITLLIDKYVSIQIDISLNNI